MDGQRDMRGTIQEKIMRNAQRPLAGVIDSHCHLDFKHFNRDREAVIENARRAGVVRMINSGVDYSTNSKSLELAKSYEFISATLGFSPNSIDGKKDPEIQMLLDQIEENASQAVGIGEAGLDYYHTKDAPTRERQAEIFKRVIAIAESFGLPLVIHSRDAEQPALDMVKHLEKVVFHCYSGTLPTMREAQDRGFYISLATNVCRSGHHQILAKNVSLDHLLVETDSPFLSPRKGRNEPANVLDAVRLIARIKGLEPQDVAAQTAANTKRIYNIH
ncbi:TatD family hydrolase [Methanothrix sp.]|jgi:TatD DNase family protein|uniref:TatD family hydrolase n=3 Tax=Methanothrix sp. TaxID=90426 RepID=UPI003BB21073